MCVSRLLTDPSAELQRALRQLLLKDAEPGSGLPPEPRWDRIENLLEIASSADDYVSDCSAIVQWW
jgi:hypothetical protein